MMAGYFLINVISISIFVLVAWMMRRLHKDIKKNRASSDYYLTHPYDPDDAPKRRSK